MGTCSRACKLPLQECGSAVAGRLQQRVVPWACCKSTLHLTSMEQIYCLMVCREGAMSEDAPVAPGGRHRERRGHMPMMGRLAGPCALLPNAWSIPSCMYVLCLVPALMP